MELHRRGCPQCKSQEIKKCSCYETKNNCIRVPYEYYCCETFFFETKNTFPKGLTKPISLIIMVVKARAEGMAFMQLVEPLKFLRIHLLIGKVGLPLLRRFFSCLPWLMSLSKMAIKSDELYKAVKKNVPPEDSRGWTIVLMGIASPFIWFMAV